MIGTRIASTAYLGYSLIRAGFKCIGVAPGRSEQERQILTERAMLVDIHPYLYSDLKPYKAETRSLLAMETIGCIFTSPLTTLFHIPGDMIAIEVILRGENPSKYGYTIEKHPMFCNTYRNLSEFILA